MISIEGKLENFGHKFNNLGDVEAGISDSKTVMNMPKYTWVISNGNLSRTFKGLLIICLQSSALGRVVICLDRANLLVALALHR